MADAWNGGPGAKTPVALLIESPGPSCLRLAPQATGNSVRKAAHQLPHQEVGPTKLQKVQTRKLPCSASGASWLHTGSRRSSKRERARCGGGPRSPRTVGQGLGPSQLEGISESKTDPLLTTYSQGPRDGRRDTEPHTHRVSTRSRQCRALSHL